MSIGRIGLQACNIIGHDKMEWPSHNKAGNIGILIL